MQHISRTTLSRTLLYTPILAVVLLIGGCDNSRGSAPATNLPDNEAAEENLPSAITTGTVAVSPEALFDFLYVATRFEFWNCASSNDANNTYIALDAKDDDTHEGYNPLLLMGLLREPQLTGDPRALNEDDLSNNVELDTIPVSFFVTGSDSITITLHADDYTSSVEDTMVYLSEVRTGPGRAFTAEDIPNSIHLTCAANNVDANVML